MMVAHTDKPKTASHRPRLILHADDFGLCEEVTNDIMDCIRNGAIHRASVICNTDGAALASEMFNKADANFEVGLHLNLVEGKPVSAQGEVSLLIDLSTGEFRYGFLSLWKDYVLGSAKKRKSLKAQIKREVEYQILTFNRFFNQNRAPIHIDGHTHVHILPFVLDIIIGLSQKHNIRSIRLPNERFFMSRKNLRHYLSANMVKHIVLKILSKTQVRKIKKAGLKHNDYFIGILSSGEMNVQNVLSALKALDGIGEDSVVEILFHPGGVRHRNHVDWTTRAQFINYYSDSKRHREKLFLCNGDLKKITDPYQQSTKL